MRKTTTAHAFLPTPHIIIFICRKAAPHALPRTLVCIDEEGNTVLLLFVTDERRGAARLRCLWKEVVVCSPRCRGRPAARCAGGARFRVVAGKPRRNVVPPGVGVTRDVVVVVGEVRRRDLPCALLPCEEEGPRPPQRHHHVEDALPRCDCTRVAALLCVDLFCCCWWKRSILPFCAHVIVLPPRHDLLLMPPRV